MGKQTAHALEQHVDILGWLYIIMNAFIVLTGALVFPFIIGGGLISGDSTAFFITSIVATVVLGIMLLLSVPGLITGYGLLKRRSWARPLGIILGILNLGSFPIGTAVGIYALWVLLQSEAAEIFA